MRRYLLAALMFTVGLAARSGVCQEPVPSEETGSREAVAERFNRGVELASEKRYEEAIAVWLEVFPDLAPADRGKAHMALGLAFKRLEMYPEAWHHLATYLGNYGAGDRSAASWAEEIEEKLRADYTKVAIICDPAGANLYLEPSRRFATFASPPIYQCPVTWWFKPGKNSVHVEKDGFDAVAEELNVRQRGDTGQRHIRLEKAESQVQVVRIDDSPPMVEATEDPEPVPAVEAPQPDVLVAQPEEGKSKARILEWSLMGGGVAMTVVGGILHGVAASRNKDLYDKYNRQGMLDGDVRYRSAFQDDVQPMVYASYALYGVGLATAATGAVLYFVSGPTASAMTSTSVSVAPWELPGGGGAVLTIGW